MLLHTMNLPQSNGVEKVFDETLDYTLFVHGWNTTPRDRQLGAETLTKSLYWQGYRGAVGLFDWPTFFDSEGSKWHPDAEYALNLTYTPSEYVALRSSNALRMLLQQKGPNTTLVAHSMGNMVALEAMMRQRLWSTARFVKTYIALQAAVPATALGVTGVNNDSIDPRAPPITSWLALLQMQVSGWMKSRVWPIVRSFPIYG